MFDLENSIAEWRRQMLAAGIRTPIALDELEGHLREEVERQIRLETNKQKAFEAAVQCVGQADVLQTEFAKNGDFSNLFGDDKGTRTNQILGAVWLVQCTWFLTAIVSSPVAGKTILYFPHFWSSFVFFFAILFSAGVFGSILLFRSAKSGLSIIRIIATLGFLLCVTELATQDGSFGIPKRWIAILALFNLVTVWLLHLPKTTIPTTKSHV